MSQKKNDFRYRYHDLPSPEFATTMPKKRLKSADDSPTVEFQDFPLTFFRDAGFFKFCYEHFSCMNGKRELTPEESKKFLSQSTFEIVDFMLTTTRHCTPLALFFVSWPNADDVDFPRRFVCVQIHFKPTETSVDHVTEVYLASYNVRSEEDRIILSDIIFKDESTSKSTVPPLLMS